jgi:phosphohistidine phosphatase
MIGGNSGMSTMQLLVIRHAIAEDKEAFAKSGKPDTERPLTRHGRAAMARVAKGLRKQVRSIDVLAASPLVRAVQTASIIAKEYGGLSMVTVPALAPQSAPAAFASWLRTQRDAEMLAVVGHEPHLGTLITWLISGRRDPHVTLEKGGVCMLEIDERPGARCATLTWLLTPDVLAKLARK